MSCLKRVAYLSSLAAMAIAPAMPARATSSDQAATADQTDEQKPKEPLVCRREPVLGSRTRVNKVCMTKSEWDEIAQKTGEAVGKLQRGSASGAGNYGDATRAVGAMGGT